MECSYAPGTQKAAKALLALREGWGGLRRFPLQDRAALVFTAGMLLPYSAPETTGQQVRTAALWLLKRTPSASVVLGGQLGSCCATSAASAADADALS